MMLLKINKHDKKILNIGEKEVINKTNIYIMSFQCEENISTIMKMKNENDLKEVMCGWIDCLRFKIIQKIFHPL